MLRFIYIFTTTTATTSIATRRSRCARCSTGTHCNGTASRSCTTSIRRRRCSTPSSAAEAPQNPNLDPILAIRRAADDGQLRDGPDGEMRHAGRLDARVRRRCGRPAISRSCRKSNHNGMIRMLRRIQGTSGNEGTTKLRQREHYVPPGQRGQGRRCHPAAGRRGDHCGTQQPGAARLVPPMAGDRRVRLVAAQQHQLRRDRRADRAAVHRGVPRRHPVELLPEVAQLD